MQRCTYCGADLPENARFCGACGHVPPQAPQVNSWPQPPSAPQQPNAWNQQPAAPQQPQQSGGWPQQQPGAWSQQPFAPQQPQQPQQAGAWNQQQQSGAWPPQAQQPGVPQQQGASEQFYAPSQAAQTGQAFPQMAPGGQPPLQPPQQPPFMPAPGTGGRDTKGPKAPFPKWIFLALVAVLIIGGGITAFALLNHHPNQPPTGPGANTAPTHGPTTVATTSNGNTPTLGGSPITTPTVLPNCPGGFSRTGAFKFSGSVTGQMTVAQFAACGPITVTENGIQVKEYVGVAMGTIGNSPYQFIFGAFPYNNPGTYTGIGVVGRLTQTSSTQVWQNELGVAAATIIINADGKSGSLAITLPKTSPADPTNTVNVTGTWSS